MMFHYDYHCLIDNKRLRTHMLFHLALKYNTIFFQLKSTVYGFNNLYQ